MKPPKQSCGDLNRWQRAIRVVLQDLGNHTPKELVELFSPDYNVRHEELDKHRRQELFANYMTKTLGIEFRFTTPTDKYPSFLVQISVGLHGAHTRLEMHLPRSIAEFIKHEGALREDSKRKFVLSGAEAKLFEAWCIVRGLDPQDSWVKLKIAVLTQEVDVGELSSREGRLHEQGLYLDELLKTFEDIKKEQTSD